MDGASLEQGKEYVSFGNVRRRDGKQIVIEHDEIGALARLQRTRRLLEAIGKSCVDCEGGERRGQADPFAWQKGRVRFNSRKRGTSARSTNSRCAM